MNNTVENDFFISQVKWLQYTGTRKVGKCTSY